MAARLGGRHGQNARTETAMGDKPSPDAERVKRQKRRDQGAVGWRVKLQDSAVREADTIERQIKRAGRGATPGDHDRPADSQKPTDLRRPLRDQPAGIIDDDDRVFRQGQPPTI